MFPDTKQAHGEYLLNEERMNGAAPFLTCQPVAIIKKGRSLHQGMFLLPDESWNHSLQWGFYFPLTLFGLWFCLLSPTSEYPLQAKQCSLSSLMFTKFTKDWQFLTGENPFMNFLRIFFSLFLTYISFLAVMLLIEIICIVNGNFVHNIIFYLIVKRRSLCKNSLRRVMVLK